MRKFILIALPLVSLYGCSCDRQTKNIVADLETRHGIYGVQVLSVAATDGKQSQEKYTFTDSFGTFEAGFTKSGIAKCPILKLTLSKAGYDTERVVEPVAGDTIFLRRRN